MNLPSSKHIIIHCKVCSKEKVILTQNNHYCSQECARDYWREYWRKAYLKRKTDPVAKEHVRKAKHRYDTKNSKHHDPKTCVICNKPL